MSLPRPSKKLVAAGFQFFYDRYALAAAGLKLAGVQMRSDGREVAGYVFSRGGHVFLGAHVMHQVSRTESFYAAMESYAEAGILVPREIADIEMELSKTYYAYQLTGNRVALRTLLGPLRSRMVGPWSDVVLEQQVGEDRRLRSVWQNVTRAFRNDPVAKSNASWRVTLPTWFAAYWADRAAVAGLTRRRPWRPPARSHVPRLPKRFRV